MEATSHERVERFLKTLRESFPDAVKVYTQGSCYRVYLLLAQVFDGVEAWTDINHVISRIEGRFYDITGEVEPTGYKPMTEDGHRLQAPHRYGEIGLMANPDYAELVREVAQMDPEAATFDETPVCVFCRVETSTYTMAPAVEHLESCLWARARRMLGMEVPPAAPAWVSPWVDTDLREHVR